MSEFFRDLLLVHAWQIAAMTLLVLAIARWVGERRPRLVHALWLLVILKCLTPPLWGHRLAVFSTAQSLFSQSEAAPTTEPAAGAVANVHRPPMSPQSFDEQISQLSQGQPAELLQAEIVAGEVVPPGTDRGATFDIGEQIVAAAMLLLIGGALLYAIVLTTRYLRCRREIHARRCDDFDSLTQPIMEKLCRQLRIRHAPTLIVADVRWGPAVMGFFRRVIVLPRCLLEATVKPPGHSDDLGQWLEPIIAHELLHIRRGDLFAGVLQSLAQCVWWFHPGVWFANRMLSRETERCCDTEVIAELGCRPATYARCLLSVIELKQPLRAVPVFPGMKPVEITSERMERIMSQTTETGGRRRPLQNGLAVALAAVLLLPGAAASGPAESEPAVSGPADENSASPAEPAVKSPTAQVSLTSFRGGRLVTLTPGDTLNEHPEPKAAMQQLLDEFREAKVTIEAVQNEIRELQSLLRAQGFLDATVGARVQNGPPIVKYTVDSGARYRIRRLQVPNATLSEPIDLSRVSRLITSRYITDASMKDAKACIAECYRLDQQDMPQIKITPVLGRQPGIVDLSIEVIHTTEDSKSDDATPHPDPADDAKSDPATPIAVATNPPEAAGDPKVITQLDSEMTLTEFQKLAGIARDTRDNANVISTQITSDLGHTGELQITVTPRIIIQEEEELLMLPLLPSDSVQRSKEIPAANSTQQTPQHVPQVNKSDQMSTQVYAIADLVVPTSGWKVPVFDIPIEPRKAATQVKPGATRYRLESATQETEAKKATEATPETEATEATKATRAVPGPLRAPATPGKSAGAKWRDQLADEGQRQLDQATSGLIALIKASVRPDSWVDDAAVNLAPLPRGQMNLVVRQTEAGHDEVTRLLADLRREQDVMVVMEATVIKLPTEEAKALTGVEFRTTDKNFDWALLSESKVGSIVESLQAEGGRILNSPRITTLPNVTAQVEVSGRQGSPSLQLSAVPRLMGDTGLMRLEFTARLGQSRPISGTNTLKTEQTLLLKYEPRPPASAAQKWQRALDQKVSLHYRNVPLTHVLRNIAEVTNTNVALDVRSLAVDSGHDPKVSVNLQNVPLKVALDEVITTVSSLNYELNHEVITFRAIDTAEETARGSIIAITPRIIRRGEMPLSK